MNLRGECIIPDCFSGFRGSDMENAITNETAQYSLSFGEKSHFDFASESLFREFGKKANTSESQK